jgi:dienelactone hydrolase
MRASVGQTATPARETDYAAQGASILQKLAAGHYGGVEAHFDERMAKDLPQAELSDQWKQMVVQAGTFVKVATTTVTQELGGYHVVVMSCVFERAGEYDALVTFDKEGRIAGLYFGPQPTEVANQWSAPSYSVANRFDEVPITVTDGPWHLPGTLSLPKGNGPFPVIVLVPGSPPLDQDATVGPNKVFKDLAWGLASRGIAALRYTKRTHQFGAGLGSGPISSFTLREELDDDTRAAVTLLAGRSDVDHQQIFLVGHSLGGIGASQVAADNSQIAGVVAMGTPSADLLTVLLQRVEDSASQGGEEGKQASQMIPVLTKLRDGGYAPGEIVDLFGQRSPVSYWAGLRNYEPAAETAKLKIRVMVMVGGDDGEVPPEDFNHWKVALAGRGNDTLKFYPGVFHLFMPSTATQKGDTSEDWTRPSHVSPEVVDDLASWILSKAKR